MGELDNRGSHLYLTLYWTQALANQTDNAELLASFGPLAKVLQENDINIVEELNAAPCDGIEIGGYYLPDMQKTTDAMRPSNTFNQAIASVSV